MKSKRYYLVVLAILVSSCATIFTGTSDNISFASNPSGAKIYMDGLKIGTTPATITIQRSFNERRVTLKLDGYDVLVFVLQREFNTVAILNLAGILGWGIDAMTGAIYRYNPKGYELDLEVAVGYNLKDLDRDQWGHYIVPNDPSVRISDEVTGLVLVFN